MLVEHYIITVEVCSFTILYHTQSSPSKMDMLVSALERDEVMTEVRQRPTLRVHFREVSVLTRCPLRGS